MRVPSGSPSLRANRVLPGVNIPYSLKLSEIAWLAGSTQVMQAEDGGNRDTYVEWAQSLLMGTRVFPNTNAWFEWYATLPTARSHEQNGYFLDAGITYLSTSHSQLDARLGVRLNDHFGAEVFGGVGFSVRFG